MRVRFLIVTVLVALFVALPVTAQDGAPEPSNALTLEVIGTYETGVFDEGGAEIVAYDTASQQLFITNGNDDAVDILDISDPTAPALVAQIDITEFGDGLNSVAVFDGVVAVAVEAEETGVNGVIAFFDTTGASLGTVEAGPLPDMVTFTPDGTKVLVANEGEPTDDYSVDPEGSVTIIDITDGVENAAVTTVGFTEFNADGARAGELPEDVRIFGPGSTVAQDLEPEYIAVSPDGTTAYVAMQENNAVAIIDIEAGSVISILALGFKDHSLEGNGMDVNGDDEVINIATWPVFGMYQPDAIEAFEVDGTVYFVTANEGDAREYEDAGVIEEVDAIEQTLDPEVFPNAADLQTDEALGNLEVSNVNADPDGDGDYDVLYTFGARSFTIWNAADGSITFDSGDDLEQITAANFPDDFNSSNDENGDFDGRSDNKGPEPEGLTLGTIGDSTYLFLGLERIGGVMVYDITSPDAPTFVTYVNNRDFSGDAEAGTAGDLGPEGLIFISAMDSPNGENLLVVTNEVSGTTTIYSVTANE